MHWNNVRNKRGKERWYQRICVFYWEERWMYWRGKWATSNKNNMVQMHWNNVRNKRGKERWYQRPEYFVDNGWFNSELQANTENIFRSV